MDAAVIKKRLAVYMKKYAPGAGIFIIAALLMAFILYHTLGLSSVFAETTPAVRAVEYEIAELEGCIFRDESVLYSSNPGAAVYGVDDGGRVGVGTELARVYTTGDTASYLAERHRIEARVKLLENSIAMGRLTASGISETESALSSSYKTIMSALGRGELAAASDCYDGFLTALNAGKRLAGAPEELDGELKALRGELTRLDSSFGGGYESLVTDRSGYFFYSCDGYEAAYKVGLSDTVDAAGLDLLCSQPPATDTDGKYAVGKMVWDFEWRLAVKADALLCARMTEGRSYKVTFADGTALDMTLERLSPGTGGGDGVLVFSCGVMPRGFAYKRVQHIELLVGSISGYRVPLSALHTREGYDGVYILSSSEVFFRKVTVLYRGDGYAVVAERDPATENYTEFLNLNDQIIISLSDGELYDGRILD